MDKSDGVFIEAVQEPRGHVKSHLGVDLKYLFTYASDSQIGRGEHQRKRGSGYPEMQVQVQEMALL
jgi:hypothetical protein